MAEKKKEHRIINAKDSSSAAERELKPDIALKTWHYIVGLLILVVALYHKIIFGLGHFWDDLVEQEFAYRVFVRDSFTSF